MDRGSQRCGSPASGRGGSSCRCTRAATTGRAASASTSSTARSWPSRPTPGVTGYGEVCPLGPFYLPAYADGVRAGIARARARTCSARTRASSAELNRRMDAALKGHPYVKSAHRHGLLGHPRQGRPGCRSARCSAAGTATTSSSTAPSRRSRPRRWPAKVAGYRAEGYRRFQLKVGGDPDVDIARIRAVRRRCCEPGDRLVADANTGWLMHEAAAGRASGPRRRRLHRAARASATRSA